MAEKVSIAIVHPSRVFRSALEESLGREMDIEIVAHARNCETAMNVARRRTPDLLVADAEVPDCMGFLARNPGGNKGPEAGPGMIVMARRTPEGAAATIRTLEAGALDLVLLPDSGDQDSIVESLRRQLSVKLRHFASKRVIAGLRAVEAPAACPSPAPAPAAGLGAGRLRAVVMGVSTGGPRILAALVPELCQTLDLPILVVQHMPPDFTASLAQSLDAKCRKHRVVEAQDGQALEPRTVYIAPGGRHLALVRDGDRRPRLAISDEPPEEGCRPSVNVLFRSAAAVFGGRVVAVVLTGMGQDGVKGLADLKRAGAYVIAQDEGTSAVWGMPGAAVASGLVDEVLPAQEIAARIVKLSDTA